MLKTMVIRYADIGWQLLPCWYRTKIGCLRHDQASSDPVQIRRWRREWPYAEWAVLCGPRSGILAIDVDGMHGHGELEQLRRKHGLPLAPQVLSGGAAAGYHLYFRWPDGHELRSHLRLGAKLEVRGAKHLLMLPPSRHARTGWWYVWAARRAPWQLDLPEAPEWLLERMQPKPLTGRQQNTDHAKIGDRYVAAAIAGEAKAVAHAPEGQRNEALNRSTFQLCRRFGDQGFVDPRAITEAMLEAALAAGLDQREAIATIRSASRRLKSCTTKPNA
jgi:Bifunctional DNA primase/polymerase, N-terminal